MMNVKLMEQIIGVLLTLLMCVFFIVLIVPWVLWYSVVIFKDWLKFRNESEEWE